MVFFIANGIRHSSRYVPPGYRSFADLYGFGSAVPADLQHESAATVTAATNATSISAAAIPAPANLSSAELTRTNCGGSTAAATATAGSATGHDGNELRTAKPVDASADFVAAASNRVIAEPA